MPNQQSACLSSGHVQTTSTVTAQRQQLKAAPLCSRRAGSLGALGRTERLAIRARGGKHGAPQRVVTGPAPCEQPALLAGCPSRPAFQRCDGAPCAAAKGHASPARSPAPRPDLALPVDKIFAEFNDSQSAGPSKIVVKFSTRIVVLLGRADVIIDGYVSRVWERCGVVAWAGRHNAARGATEAPHGAPWSAPFFPTAPRGGESVSLLRSPANFPTVIGKSLAPGRG
jgi:hypothetical protein